MSLKIAQTQIAGGNQGTLFNDAEKIGQWPAFLKIDSAHPIRKLEIRHGWVVDSITTTYQLTDGSEATIKHGANPPNGTIITLSPDEIIATVYGKAGEHSYYKQALVNQISFIIFNKKNATTRTAGPYGNGDNTNQGAVFQSSDLLAFAGAETNGAQIGISGLSFIRLDNSD